MGQYDTTCNSLNRSTLAFSHEFFMHRCLQLAAKGLGRVAPNPLVGAVLVYQNTILGEGYHQQFGKAHAEINCLESVQESDQHLIQDATLYVSLEPCCHTGKTPPCTNAILAHKIKQVVIACRDPFAAVNGQGIQQLRDAGVNVIEGIVEQDALDLNKRFICYHTYQRPFIILKWAESLDGYMGNPTHRVQISHALSQQLVHQWRSEEQAIWVGANTAVIDNPQLNVRLTPGSNPIRVVYDKHHALSEDLHLFQSSQTTLRYHSVLNHTDSDCYVPEDSWLPAILSDLYQRGISSVLVEGGRSLLQRFLDAGLWDEIRQFQSAHRLEQGVRAPIISNAILQREKKIKDNVLRVYQAMR